MKMDKDLIKELLDYDPRTGIFIWKKRDIKWFKSEGYQSRWNTRFSGKRAGSIHRSKRNGYQWREISIFDHAYKEHRLAWMYVNDFFPEKHIDHINQDATDNRISNLKLSDASGNAKNKSKSIRNKSGYIGVRWVPKTKKWESSCFCDGNYHYLGSFSDKKEAAKVSSDFRKLNGFSESHGVNIPRYREAVN